MPNSQRVNTRWFKDQLQDRNISQRKLAKLMEMDASAVSLMLRGMRAIQLAEATELARILGLPLAEVLSQAGVDLPRESGLETVPVDGWIDAKGKIHPQKPSGPKQAPKPPGSPEGTIALRYMSDDWRDGSVLYYRPVNYVMPEAIGRLAIVEYADSGLQAVRVVKHGYEPGQYRLSPISGDETETARIVAASLVTWIRQ